MSSIVSTEKMPEERLSIPGRPSYSEPEDEQLGNDSFFIKNIKFTWVGKKFLLGVDDQGNCCCCWAFCSTEAITVAYLKKKKKLIMLSKQQLINCMYTFYEKPDWFADLEKKECYPCSYNKAYTFAKDRGIVAETMYPFTEQRGECECPSSEEIIVKIKGYASVSKLGLNKEGIQELIKEQPITCAARHVRSLKIHRGKGIYMGLTEKEVEDEKKKMEQDQDAKVLLHAMLIVGFGTEDGVDFYLVKNSWGKDWGYKGFAKIACSVLSRLSYPII
ncbi:hypothetical protein KY289_016403 [Solanum tuberosum]|nr:hypothetical protein KY284_015691 [Solanum tuberosum]KAH0689045.1 hypothetical protein KY289_016403 [Solanum tuberosum]